MTLEPLSLTSDEEVIEFLTGYCSPIEPGEVYVLAVMARPRENDVITHGNVPMFREIISDPDDIERKVRRLRAIGETFTPEEADGDDESLVFRMYVSANARDAEKAYHQFQKHLLDLKQKYGQGHEPAMKKMERLDREWESQLQADGNKSDNRFIIDVDDDSRAHFEVVLDLLTSETTVVTAVESPNGFHIVTEPFNYPGSAVTDMDNVEVKTDSLLFLQLFD